MGDVLVQAATVDSSESFSAYAGRLRAEVEVALEAALPCPPACPTLVAEAMRYSITVGGKRMRPILTLASAEAVAWANGQRDPEDLRAARELAMPAACAIEMIHTYSLVHDDLPAMDNDSLRRGQPTLHVLYGEALAILAGDGLLAEAFALLASPKPHDSVPGMTERRLRVLQQIGRAVGGAGMVGGQAIDLECAGLVKRPGGGRLSLDAQGLRDMHARKTGVLLRASAVSGAILAGGCPDQVAALDRYASELGVVFQIVDDILDIEGTSDVLGKTAGKDEAAGKLTYPAVYGLERSRELAHEGTCRALEALQAAGLDTWWLQDLAYWVLRRES
jgi:geranylgeranyl diphosphate synthase type II